MINISLFLLQDKGPTSTIAERNLLIYMITVLLILCSLIIIFFIVFQKRKNKLLLDKIRQQQAFEEEISNTQIEIQEQTLKNIGQELHDNIGQLLSVANMQLSIMSSQVQETIKEQFTETKDVVKDSLREVRALSKSLNSDIIVNRGLHESVQNEVDRLNRLQLITTELISEGDKSLFNNNKDSIILFRILQEFISNTVKYASAEHLKINLEYTINSLVIHIQDDGKGFDLKTAEKGSGLLNMKSRADLIQADLKLQSKIDKGTDLKLIYNYRNKVESIL